MPYDNVPESMWGEMDKCVEGVMSEGKDKEAAIAICFTSIMGKSAYIRDNADIAVAGDEVKALGDGRVGGYLVRYTSPNDLDATGDYFDNQTQIQTPASLPVLYNHGMDKKMSDTVIGSGTVKADDVGIWIEAQLNMRDKYEKAIYELVQKGKLGWSSGAISHLVKREPVGKAMHIKSWWIGEASLTPTPAEYRNTVLPFKSLQILESPLSDMENIKMNEETKVDVKSEVAEAVKSALAIRDAEIKAEADRQAAIKAAEDAGYQKAVKELADRKPATKYHSIDPEKKGDDNDGMQAFKAWMQTGQVNDGLISPQGWDTKTAFNAGITSDATGGFLVPDPMYNQIIAKRNNASFIRQVPAQVFQTQSNHILVNVEDTSATAFVATAEEASYNENEGTFAQKDLILYKYTKVTKASEEFISYNAVNFESWLSDSLARAEATLENTLYLTGTGTGEAQGVLTGATSGNVVTTSAVLVPADVSALMGQLGANYNVQGQTALVMKNATKWYLKGLPVNAAFAFSPTPNDFWGVPVVINDNMSAYTVASASGKSMLFGNFNFYGLVEKPGMMVQRNPYLYMATGQIGIFASIYRGGAVLQAEAFYYSVGK